MSMACDSPYSRPDITSYSVPLLGWIWHGCRPGSGLVEQVVPLLSIVKGVPLDVWRVQHLNLLPHDY